MERRLKRIGEKFDERDDKTPPQNPKKMMMDVFEAFREASGYEDDELRYDRMKWLSEDFERFPYEYNDYSIHRWTIGIMLAQINRYGGVLMETDFGLLPQSKDKKLMEE